MAPRGRIWIVDDEPLVGRSIGRVLKRRHDIEYFTSALEVVKRLELGATFDLLLCDLMMPLMTGLELHDLIVARYPAHISRLVLMTGGVFSEEMRRGLERVARPVLEKPFDVAVLEPLLAEVVHP